MTVLTELLVVVALILVNGFFALSELAVVSSRRSRLKQLAEEGDQGAETALRLAEDPGRFLAAVQIGITLIGVLAGAFSGATIGRELGAWLSTFPALTPIAGSLGIILVVIGITYLSLIAGELVPKRIALNDAERVASRVAGPMSVLSRLAAPVVWVLRISSEAVLRALGTRSAPEVTVTEEEIKSMVAEGTEAGVFEAAERFMIEGVLGLADRPVRAIMTPRVEVIWLDPSDDAATQRREIADSGRSRFPVCRGDVDTVEGVVQAKDLLDREMQDLPFDLAACLRQPLFVHDGTPVLRLLDLFRASAVHIAVVVDEYGSFEGIVTPTDILTAIAGEFAHEDDEGEPAAVRREDGSWLVDARTDVEQVERLLGRRGLRSEDDTFHTLAGFVLRRLGHLPRIGETFRWQGLRFEVIDMDGRRIDRVLVTIEDGAAPAPGR